MTLYDEKNAFQLPLHERFVVPSFEKSSTKFHVVGSDGSVLDFYTNYECSIDAVLQIGEPSDATFITVEEKIQKKAYGECLFIETESSMLISPPPRYPFRNWLDRAQCDCLLFGFQTHDPRLFDCWLFNFQAFRDWWESIFIPFRYEVVPYGCHAGGYIVPCATVAENVPHLHLMLEDGNPVAFDWNALGLPLKSLDRDRRWRSVIRGRSDGSTT